MTNKFGNVKLWQIVLTMIITVCGVAASWGSSKAQVSSLDAQVIVLNQEVDTLKINGAVNAETLKNMDKKLDEIQAQLDRLNEKLDKLRR